MARRRRSRLRRGTVCLSALVALSVCTTSLPQAECETPNDAMLASIVRIATFNGSDASGVVVARNRVLTAAHVVRDVSVALVRMGESYHEAPVLTSDVQSDLALLAVDTGELEPFKISTRRLIESERVWAIGFPLALAQKITQGQYRATIDGMLYTSAPIASGNSGGGLVRCEAGRYELAGLVHGFLAYERDGEYVNIGESASVPAHEIASFIESSAVLYAN